MDFSRTSLFTNTYQPTAESIDEIREYFLRQEHEFWLDLLIKRLNRFPTSKDMRRLYRVEKANGQQHKESEVYLDGNRIGMVVETFETDRTGNLSVVVTAERKFIPD